MDERDRALLDQALAACLQAAEPDQELPFMDDAVLRQWRDLIAGQIAPGGVSETLDIYGVRLGKSPDDLRAMLDSPERMQSDLWANISPKLLAQVETHMNAFAREQMLTYLNEP